MAPATIAGATKVRTAARRRGGWDRDTVISAIQEWVDTYGAPPRAADWNPSSAKWSGQQWRIERYRAGRADGSPWPALNSAKRPFGGSLNAAIEAAGFAPAKPGPTRRTDVDPAQADRAVMSPEGRAMVQAALAQAREAEKRVAVLEARLERAAQIIDKTKDKENAKGKTTIKTKVVRERVVDDAAVARAERRTAAAEAKAAMAVTQGEQRTAAAKAAATEARATAKRLAARLERAEATVATLRDERRTLKAAAQQAGDRLAAATRELVEARADVAASRAEAADARRVLRSSAARTTDPGAAVGAGAVRAAEAEAAEARRTARTAELRAARAERALRETVAAVNGEARALTAAELAALRAAGPSGPAVLGASLKALARARATGATNPTALDAALLAIAQAAITWRERL
jgi:hypothetical protein